MVEYTCSGYKETMSNRAFIQFKHEKDKELYFMLHPILQKILASMALYCHTHSMPFVITSTVSTLEEDQRINRVSSTHREARAADISVRGWDAFESADFVKLFNKEYGKYGAISKATGKSKLVYMHVGTAPHLHIQIHKKYKVDMSH